MYRDPLLTAVEIGSLMTLVTESGCICTIETGYNYPANTPEQREYSFSMSTDQSTQLHRRWHAAGGRVRAGK